MAAVAAGPHENLVELFELFREKGKVFLAMQRLHGVSLRRVLRDASTLPLAETRAVVRAVGEALAYLHAKSIAHGRIAPGSVFVSDDLGIRLIDLVPLPSAALVPTETGQPPGGAGSGVSDDEFGLACLAYELLSGRHPYNANTPAEARRAGLPLAPLPGLPAEAWSALARSLALDSGERFGAIAAFMSAFGITGRESLRTLPDRRAAEPLEVLSVAVAPVPAGEPGAASDPVSDAMRDPVSDPVPGAMPDPVPDPAGDVPIAGHAGAIPVVGDVVALDEPAIITPRRAVSTSARRPRGPLVTVVAVTVLAALAGLSWRYHDRLRVTAADAFETVRPLAPAETVPGTSTASVAADAAPAVPVQGPAPRPANAGTPAPVSPAGNGPAREPAAGLESEPQPQPQPEPLAEAQLRSLSLPEPVPGLESLPQPQADEGNLAPVTAAPGFTVAATLLAVSESAGAARVVVQRDGDLSAPAAVAWWTDDGSAVADSDYVAFDRRIERFDASEVTITLFVPLINDALPEGGESFTVTLAPEDAATEGDEVIARIRVDIVDDD